MTVLLETLLVALVLAGVLGWLGALLRSQPAWRPRLVPGIVVLTVLVTGAFALLRLRYLPATQAETAGRPIAVREDGYVSSESCRSCHPRPYATWHGSYHRRMTQIATAESVLGDFDDVELRYHGRTYRLGQDGDTAWFEFDAGVDPQGDPQPVRRPIVLTTGSHHMQAYWYPSGYGRAVGFFPFVHLVPEGRWVPRESIFLQPTSSIDAPLPPLDEAQQWQQDRQWNHSCIHCHTTHGQPRFPEVDTRVGEFGIACEACHGPADGHVARNRDPRQRYRQHLGQEPDDTITDPRDLGARRASQVCGQCHGITYPRPHEVARHFGSGRSYRPGDELTDSFVVCQASPGSDTVPGCPDLDPQHRFWSDGMVRVSGREYGSLIDSPCFEGGEFSCLSCHVMHQSDDDSRPISEWAVDHLKPGMDGDLACLQCHTAYEDPKHRTAHTRHLPESTGGKCYNCHMPYTSYGLLKAIRSHEVDSPSVQTSLDTGRPNACNQCHLDKTLAWSGRHLENWYALPQPQLDDVQRAVPASLIWLLSGDAGQRALMAWSLGWEPARQASGTDWMPPFLAQLLVDPYDAVRLIAGRSFQSHPGFEDFEYDFLAPPDELLAAAQRAGAGARNRPDLRALLDDPAPGLPHDIFARLLRQRDDRVVRLTE